MERCIAPEHFIREVQDLIEYLNDNQAYGRSSPDRDTAVSFVPSQKFMHISRMISEYSSYCVR